MATPPPPPRCCPGFTVNSVVPSAAMRSLTACCAPVPSATTAITAPTPITMPSIVSSDRSLFALSAPRATAMISPMSISSTPATAATTTAAAAAAAATRTAAPRSAAGATAWSARPLTAKGAGVLAEAILLLLTLRLQSQRAEHHDVLALLEAFDDFRVIEVALTEAHDAGMEVRLRAVGNEHEALTRTLRTLAQLIRLRELATTPALAALSGVSELSRTAGIRTRLAHLATTARASGPRVDVQRRIDGAHLLADRLHLGTHAAAAATTALRAVATTAA